ncbi:uncharacterized protein LOC101857650 [Aplysia californica]|uniref:Uncharacterized protein LOC101857650 n=1 Tax=Aplysia californica TaxID=6500 RepID=A0ABM0JSV6_APLCA|nr:uncharacterized protein LOC101857650 [Aplysia californica]
MRIPISNRKLTRVGVAVAGCMSLLVVYLAYHDFLARPNGSEFEPRRLEGRPDYIVHQAAPRIQADAPPHTHYGHIDVHTPALLGDRREGRPLERKPDVFSSSPGPPAPQWREPVEKEEGEEEEEEEDDPWPDEDEDWKTEDEDEDTDVGEEDDHTDVPEEEEGEDDEEGEDNEEGETEAGDSWPDMAAFADREMAGPVAEVEKGPSLKHVGHGSMAGRGSEVTTSLPRLGKPKDVGHASVAGHIPEMAPPVPRLGKPKDVPNVAVPQQKNKVSSPRAGNSKTPAVKSEVKSTVKPRANSTAGSKTVGKVSPAKTSEVKKPPPPLPQQQQQQQQKPKAIPVKPEGLLPPRLNKTSAHASADRKYLVYVCDDISWCGGWGDRQRGMVGMYLLARLVDRELRIVMSTPCSISQFYRPHLVNWIPQGDELKSSSHLAINTFTVQNFKLELVDGDFNKKFPQKVLYLKSNQDFYTRLRKNKLYAGKLKRWSGLTSKKGRFRWAWSELMQPTPPLLRRLERVLGSEILIRQGILSHSLLNATERAHPAPSQVGNASLICAHVRVGKNPTIPMDEDFDTFSLDDLPTLRNFLQSKDVRGDARFFVATDYDFVRQQFQTFFGTKLVEYGGKIMHIDRQRNQADACGGFEVALLDQLILSMCDVLVVSRSGFSIHASHVSNSTSPVYVLEGGNISRLVP